MIGPLALLDQKRGPSTSMTAFFETKSRKLLAAIEKATGYPKSTDALNNDPRSRDRSPSCWDKLPVELRLAVICRCRLLDIQCLRLVSRSLRELIDTNEYAIARDYLRLRRHGSLPVPIEDRETHTRAPQDDVILLSNLFPPSNYDSRDAYSFRYLAGLRRRQETCSKLSYYLADRVLDRYMQTDPAVKASFASKRDRQACYDRGVALLQFKFTPIMFYVLYFLENYSRAKSNSLNIYYSEYESGRQVHPRSRAARISDEHLFQWVIIGSHPFRNLDVLLSVHHVFFLLASYLRDAVAPDYPFNSTGESLASMLLTIGLERIVEFFAAEKGGGYNQRALRKTFMRNMQKDWDAYTKSEKVTKVYGHEERNHAPFPLNYIWHAPAVEELSERGGIPHQSRDWVMVWEGVKIYLNCQHCEGMHDGWAAVSRP